MFLPARLSAITRKELRHITRDARIFFLVTLSPAFILLVLSYLFSFDIGTVRIGWLDQDHSALSRSYHATITADNSSAIVAAPDSPAALEHALYAGIADIAVTVPAGFDVDFERWRATLGRVKGQEILAAADGTDAISASHALDNLAQQTAAFGARLAAQAFPFAEDSEEAVATRIWFNSALNSQCGMVHGLIAIALTLHEYRSNGRVCDRRRGRRPAREGERVPGRRGPRADQPGHNRCLQCGPQPAREALGRNDRGIHKRDHTRMNAEAQIG